MKRVVSVSLGLSSRDYDEVFDWAGLRFGVKRIGVDGCLQKAAKLIRELDGRVDAIGLGGVNMRYRVSDSVYDCPDGMRLARLARVTPVVDGSIFKSTYEPDLPRVLIDRGFRFSGSKALCVSVLDRWELARALEREGARVMVGDAAFALGIPIRFAGLRAFEVAARLSMWALARIPIGTLYPLEGSRIKGGRAFSGADYVVGDFHFIRRHLPADLGGKWIITTTTTPDDRQRLRRMGATGVVTMTEPVNGRSLSANVFDALAVAHLGKLAGAAEVRSFWARMGLKPCTDRF